MRSTNLREDVFSDFHMKGILKGSSETCLKWGDAEVVIRAGCGAGL